MYWLLSLLLTSAITIHAIQGTAMETFITGNIIYQGDNKIEKGSQILVELRDLNTTLPLEKSLGVTDISEVRSFPIPYKVNYNPSIIMPGHMYSVSIKINGPDGKLQYTNVKPTRIEFHESKVPVMDIPVQFIEPKPVSIAPKSSNDGSCSPLTCDQQKLDCSYGLLKKNGCPVCECNDPCYPPNGHVMCEPEEECVVKKESDDVYTTECVGKHEKRAVARLPLKRQCKLPLANGRCRAALPRYYYNTETRACTRFTYSGCGGNENNFETKEDCDQICLGITKP